MPASLSSSACSSSRVISSAMALMRPTLLAHRAQQAHRLDRQLGAAQDDVAHLTHLQLEALDLEQGDRLGGLLHLVDGIVEQADQLLDVAAVEGGDEGAPRPTSTARVMASARSS